MNAFFVMSPQPHFYGPYLPVVGVGDVGKYWFDTSTGSLWQYDGSTWTPSEGVTYDTRDQVTFDLGNALTY